MAETKKSPKRIIDVQHPDKTPANDTSKPVIVTNRPILQDPMMAEDNSKPQNEQPLAKTGGTTIKPLTAPEVPADKQKADAAKDEPEVDTTEKPEEPAKSDPTDPPAQVSETKTLADLDAESKSKTDNKPGAAAKDEPAKKDFDDSEDSKDPEGTPEAEAKANDKLHKDEEVEAEKQAQRDEELLKLTETKQYFLPINSVEKRRSKQVVLGGVLLSLILIVAWVDIALDAGLIELGSIKAVTHFF
jgi:hypothetical protein